ncbi:hypothetical protein THRCLA_20671 [Thraustotheca clavata]|uniref:Uncharacterized protein n=1 Tax=Thraustotheca clavata TaxID=74557 RepID=A0A1W0A4Q9_9STRA|nr:hypothetical protein THRCLA_20671 [Thraustotheca clavata]
MHCHVILANQPTSIHDHIVTFMQGITQYNSDRSVHKKRQIAPAMCPCGAFIRLDKYVLCCVLVYVAI